MRNQRGEIPSGALRIAVCFTPVDVPLGVHGTEFLGTDLDARLVVQDQDGLYEIDPVTGELTLFSPPEGTILRDANEFRLDALCYLAEQVHRANTTLSSVQGILKGGRAAGVQDLADLYGDYDDGLFDDACEPTVRDASGNLIFAEGRAEHVRSHGISQEDILVGNEGQSYWHGLIDYERRVVFLSHLLEPVLDSPGLGLKRAIERLADTTYPGEEPWAVVVAGSDDATIVEARLQQPKASPLVTLSPVRFSVDLDRPVATSLAFDVRPEGLHLSFVPVGDTRELELFQQPIDKIRVEFMASTGAARKEAIVMVPGLYWPAIVTNPQLSAAMAKAIPGLNCYKKGRLLPPERVLFVLRDAIWNEDLDTADAVEEGAERQDGYTERQGFPPGGAYVVSPGLGITTWVPPESYWS